jgi:hypothetical protein
METNKFNSGCIANVAIEFTFKLNTTRIEYLINSLIRKESILPILPIVPSPGLKPSLHFDAARGLYIHGDNLNSRSLHTVKSYNQPI